MPTLAPRIPGWRRLLSSAGPGYLIAVGYMDPGNWATSLAAGSAFGYSSRVRHQQNFLIVIH